MGGWELKNLKGLVVSIFFPQENMYIFLIFYDFMQKKRIEILGKLKKFGK